ncbi:MAG TPA: NADH-quinone oxidoreductase subunit N [Gemmatimonadaceae bacterium]|nr:NADH-quinone oxidoreductase subunit N [Gemmatimonadaceae bacterium]
MITTLDITVPLQLSLALVPDLVLMGGAMVLLLWASLRPDSQQHQRNIGIASIVLCGITILLALNWAGRYSAGPGPIALDNFRWLIDVVVLLGTIFTIALSMDDNMRTGIAFAESHVLILLASSGMMLLAAARDLMIVFLGIELMSISVYALAGLNRRSERSAEGALKYFLLGAFSTAFLLYGIALVYGATGSTNLTIIAGRISIYGLTSSPLLITGIALLLIGFGFKVATVPFHMWAPDVYDGAPSAITAYMAATVKAAAFAAFIRVWLEAFNFTFQSWHGAMVILAIATMVMGNAIGLVQKNLKRMLAYSSIGHAGYLLVAVAAGTAQGSSAMLFYLFIYTLATFGAFAVVIALQREGRGTVMLDELAGLWSVSPWLAVTMGVLMLALMGFPIFGGAGFYAKWYVLQAALQAPIPQTTLAVTLVLTTVISAGYYLYVLVLMFMRPRIDGIPAPERSGGLTRMVLGVSVALLLILGFAPEYLVRIARNGRPRYEVTPTTTSLPPSTAAIDLPPPMPRHVADRAAEPNR